MNISELYFLKTLPCKRSNCSNQNFCYFHHKHETDKRRFPVDFLSFFSANKLSNSIGSQIFKANQLKNELKLYSNESGFSDQNLKQVSNCVNFWEKGFHVLNYLERKCKLDEKDFLIECPNKLFCADFHFEENEGSQIKSKSHFNQLPFYRELGNCFFG